MNVSKRYRFTNAGLIVIPPAIVILTLLFVQNVWVTFLSYQVLFGFLVPFGLDKILRNVSYSQIFSEIGFRHSKLITLGTLFGIGIVAAGIGLFALFGTDLITSADVLEALDEWSITPSQFIPVTIFMVLCNGIGEELYWRGYMVNRLQHLDMRFRISLLAVAYSSYHFVTLFYFSKSFAVSAVLTLLLIGLAVFWNYLREIQDSIWIPLLMHFFGAIAYMSIFWIWLV